MLEGQIPIMPPLQLMLFSPQEEYWTCLAPPLQHLFIPTLTPVIKSSELQWRWVGTVSRISSRMAVSALASFQEHGRKESSCTPGSLQEWMVTLRGERRAQLQEQAHKRLCHDHVVGSQTIFAISLHTQWIKKKDKRIETTKVCFLCSHVQESYPE